MGCRNTLGNQVFAEDAPQLSAGLDWDRCLVVLRCINTLQNRFKRQHRDDRFHWLPWLTLSGGRVGSVGPADSTSGKDGGAKACPLTPPLSPDSIRSRRSCLSRGRERLGATPARIVENSRLSNPSTLLSTNPHSCRGVWCTGEYPPDFCWPRHGCCMPQLLGSLPSDLAVSVHAHVYQHLLLPLRRSV